MAILVRSRYVKQWVCHTGQWGSGLDFKESPLINMASKSTFTDINPSNGVAISKDRNDGVIKKIDPFISKTLI